MDNTKNLTHISLCHGYGGIDIGLNLATGGRIKTVAICEIEAACIENTLAKMEEGRVEAAPIWTDLKSFPWAEFHGKVDILSGGYPCFEEGTFILTRSRGYAPIESVAVGELVLTHTGAWKPVTAVMHKEGASTVSVNPSLGTEMFCTREHPFYARERKFGKRKITRVYNGKPRSDTRSERFFGDAQWVEAGDIDDKSQRLGFVFPTEQCESEHSESIWWLTGRYLADGHTQWHKTKPKARVCISANDSKIGEVVRRCRDASFSPYVESARTCNKAHITRTWFAKWCEQFGKYSHGKFIPGWVLGIEQGLLRAFVDGYMAGDGHFEKRGGRYTSVSEPLALGIAQCYSKAYGCAYSICKKVTPDTTIIEGRTVNQRDYFTGSFTPSGRRGKHFGDSVWSEVRTGSGHENVTVYNIAVEDDESYVANGVIVHNCQPFSAAGKRLGKDDPRHLWPWIADGIRIMRPSICFFENVEGHISLGLSTVVSDLEELGYSVSWGIFSAAEVGAPHQRKRVFILAVADGQIEGLERYDGLFARCGQSGRDAPQPEGQTGRSDCCGDAWPARPGQPQYDWEEPRVV